MDEVDCIVAGAGVVGLAVARELALSGRDVLILEAADAIGTGTSSRNSEVIHAGLYYAPGSLKAGLCVSGRDSLYEYCAERGIPHQRCGKLIVATGAGQEAALDAIADNAGKSGAGALQKLTAAEAKELEPARHPKRRHIRDRHPPFRQCGRAWGNGSGRCARRA
jgi:L-2-hydroxyglutarate oxidase LhgO